MKQPEPWSDRLAELTGAEKAGDWPTLLALARRIWDEARAAGLSDAAITAALTGSRHLANAGRLAEAAQWLTEVAELAGSEGKGGVEIDALVTLAGVQASLGRAEPAARAMVRAVDLMGTVEMSREGRQRALNALSVAYYQFGLSRHSSRLMQESLDLLPPEPGEMQGLMGRLNLCMTFLTLHDESVFLPADDAQDWLAQAKIQIDEAEPLLVQGPTWLNLFAVTLRAGWLRRSGFAEESIARLRDALQTWPEAGPPTLHEFARLELAQALGERGASIDEARGMAEDLLRLARGHPGAATSMFQLENIALLADLAGRHEEAFVALRRCLALMRQGMTTLLDAQSAGLSRRLGEHSQRQLNVDLLQRNQDLARRVEAMSHAAAFDGLTGVLNRRGLEAAFERLRGQRPFALAMVDVDHFKQINDQHLHLVGDDVLRRLGALLQDAVRGPDTVARYGGEEFVLLLAEAELETARSVAERLRQRIELAPWHELVPGLAVTVSIGVAMTSPHEALGEVLARADRMLYEAKHAGRNRVVAEPPAAAPPVAG